jgi:hypothetical protein
VNALRCPDPVQSGQCQIQQNHVRPDVGQEIDRVATIVGFTYNCNVGLCVEHRPKALAQHHMLVGQ